MIYHERRCIGLNAAGEPCQKASTLVGDDGYCVSHRPGSTHNQTAAAAGAAATNQIHQREGLKAGELPDVTDIASALVAFNVIGQAHAARRITDKENDSAVKRLDGQVKAIAASMTSNLVTELRAQLDRSKDEIAALRKQLNGSARLKVTA